MPHTLHPWRLRFVIVALVLGMVACPEDDEGVPPPPEEDPICTGDRPLMPRPGATLTLARACSNNEECSDGVFCNGVEVCRSAPAGETSTRCDCGQAPDESIPCQDERATCDEALDVCLYACDIPPDVDNDGVWNMECGGSDCDDSDATRNPDQTEVCDAAGFDEDCDPNTFGGIDADQDGFFDIDCFNLDGEGNRIGGRDCDDGDASVHPIQNEVCNGIDDDCDGDIDEEVRVQLYVDDDGDGFGTGDPVLGCAPTIGFSILSGDCDDNLATLFPGAVRCDTSNPQVSDAIEICGADGNWKGDSCEASQTCVPQPAGTGVCI